jgi:hypothetical protein
MATPMAIRSPRAFLVAASFAVCAATRVDADACPTCLIIFIRRPPRSAALNCSMLLARIGLADQPRVDDVDDPGAG